MSLINSNETVDVVLFAPSAKGLQTLLDTCTCFAANLLRTFSAAQTTTKLKDYAV